MPARGSGILRRRAVPAVVAGAVAVATLCAAGPAVAGPSFRAGHHLNVVVSDDPANWTPNALDGSVYAFAQVGSEIVVGGTFTKVQAAGGGPVLTRNDIFAFDATTGAIDTSFAPGLDGDVWALEPAADGHSVYVGGSFAHANGAVARKLVELNVANGQRVEAFQAQADAVVRDIELDGPDLYVAGAFQSLDGVHRTNLGRVDAITGAIDPNMALTFGGPRMGATSIHHMDITPDGTKLVAIGNFTTVGGLRRSQVVVLNLTTNPVSVSTWQTNHFDDRYYPHCSVHLDSYVRDVQFSPDGSYFVTVATGGPSGVSSSGTMCDAASRWETNAGANAQPTWVDYTGGDTFWSVAVTGTAVYVGGHERWLNNPLGSNSAGPGAVSRPGIGALDPRNGLPLSWNPTKDRGVGTFVLYATDQGLWVGSDTEHIGGEYHGRLAFMPAAGGTTMPDDSTGRLPHPLLSGPLSGHSVVVHPANGTGFGTPSTMQTAVDWGSVRSAMLVGGTLYTAGADGRLIRRAFDSSDGSSGPPATVDLLGLGSGGLSHDLQSMTGMFFDPVTGRWYYTVAGDDHLYYRYFTAESRVIGGLRFVAATGPAWAHVAGMTLSGHTLFTADGSGNLWRTNWTTRPAGTRTRVGGPSVDGRNWRSHGLFFAS